MVRVGFGLVDLRTSDPSLHRGSWHLHLTCQQISVNITQHHALLAQWSNVKLQGGVIKKHIVTMLRQTRPRCPCQSYTNRAYVQANKGDVNFGNWSHNQLVRNPPSLQAFPQWERLQSNQNASNIQYSDSVLKPCSLKIPRRFIDFILKEYWK